jgi:hypothetical protein
MTTDLESTFIERLQSAKRTAADFERRWREWSEEKDRFKKCVKHDFNRRLNTERSIAVSWREQQFMVVYHACPGCLREKFGKKRK